MQFTQDQADLFIRFLVENGLPTEGKPGEQTGELFGGYHDKFNLAFTRENLERALKDLRPHLIFLPHAEAEYKRLLLRMSEQEASTVSHFLPHFHLNTDGEDFYINFNAVASWFLDRNQPIEWSNLNRLIQNVQNQPQSPLRFAKRLQDSEREALRIREEEKKRHEEYLRTHPGSKSNPEFPDGPLAAHKAMLQRPLRPGDVGYEDTPANAAASKREVSAWEQMTLNRLEHDLNSIDRADAELLIVSKARSGEIEWRNAYQRLDNWIVRRKAEKSWGNSL
jgi:hypothetical protein